MTRSVPAKTLLCLWLVMASWSSMAGDAQWLQLRGERFGIVSQLNEQQTRRWATEFDQYIDALHALFNRPEQSAPPLTVVLFDSTRKFAPYRMSTESGQVEDTAAFFALRGDWSVIGMPGQRTSPENLRTLRHEAVHWLTSTRNEPTPLWFSEGYADVLSTYQVDGTRVTWGHAIDKYLNQLNAVGLQSLTQLLNQSQDEALHHNNRFYPQAWLLVHYFLFGDKGSHRDQLEDLVRLSRTMSAEDAVLEAYGSSIVNLENDVHAYLQLGRYSQWELTLPARDYHYTVAPAAPAQVEFALARLAIGGGNPELAQRHAENVLALLPARPEGHELMATLAYERGDMARAAREIDAALVAGTSDTWILQHKAVTLFNENATHVVMSPQEILPEPVARQIAEYSAQAALQNPQPIEPFALLVRALVCTNGDSAAVVEALAVGRQFHPTSGIFRLADALQASRVGDHEAALVALAEADQSPLSLTDEMRTLSQFLQEYWVMTPVLELAADAASSSDYEALVAATGVELGRPGLSARLEQRLQAIQRDAKGMLVLIRAEIYLRAGNTVRFIDIVKGIADDEEYGSVVRSVARGLLNDL
ncbi:MAG: hypothetical protein H6978_05230 [Gammaproteobacteria bacterium]|nr:hypothetical protein [Gammaproteobacteria bacterium]